MIYLEKPESFNNRFEIISCFLEHDGKILLLLRQDHKPQGNTWGVPAGKVEDNESPLEALLREIDEETGYKSQETQPSLSKVVYVRYPEYDFTYYIYHLKLEQLHEVKIDNKSHKDFTWISPEEALKINLIQDEDACIKLHYGL